MVKKDELARKARPKTVCLEPDEPCAREYENENRDELVTVSDFTPGLQSMVLTGNVASMAGNQLSNKYVKGDLDGDGDDEQDHDTPDYAKLSRLDRVEQDAFVDEFLEDENNYEKKDPDKGKPAEPAKPAEAGSAT